MAIAFTKKQDGSHVLAADAGLPADQQTVFSIRALGARARAALLDAMVRVEGGQQVAQVGQATYKAVQLGISGWKNLRGADGQLIEFPKASKHSPWPSLDDAAMNLLTDWVNELGMAVLKFNEMAGEEGEPESAEG